MLVMRLIGIFTDNTKELVMKKTLLAVALLVCSAAVSATTLNVEYNYSTVQGDSAYKHTQYGYIGLAQSTKYGTIDAGLQGATANVNNVPTDKQSGWELGYSYPLSVDRFTVSPRIAYGAMNAIAPNFNARYWLASVEVSTRLAENIGGYVSVSHLNGANADSIARANRFQIGADWTLTKTFNLRTGYSFQRFGADNLSGVVAVGSYSF
jgi:hypothetical protein